VDRRLRYAVFTHEVFERAKAVFIDETFFQKSLRGIRKDEERLFDGAIALAALQLPEGYKIDFAEEGAQLRYFRHKLAQASQQQRELGGIVVETLYNAIINIEQCRKAILAEWEEVARRARAEYVSRHGGR
jgi:hypothetical protein